MPDEILPPFAWPFWPAAAIVVLAVTAAVVDARRGKVPNWLTYPGILLGLAGHGLLGGIYGSSEDIGLIGSLAGLAVGFGPRMLCWLAGGVGGGDAKLMGAIGAIGGWKLALGAMLYGFAIAGLMGVAVMIRRRIVRRTLRRVWRTVVLLVISGSGPADPAEPESPRIPLAVALCLGTLAAMIEPVVRSRMGL